MSLIESIFFKKCPHCRQVTDIRKLQKFRHSGPLRWYQFTPGSQSTCPECGGPVKSSAENSLILRIGFGMLIAFVLAAVFSPLAHSWLAFIPEVPYLLAFIALLISWFDLKHSELVSANDDR